MRRRVWNCGADEPDSDRIRSEFGGNLHLQSAVTRVIIGVCRCSSSVEYKLPKLRRRVRFPSSAVRDDCTKEEI